MPSVSRLLLSVICFDATLFTLEPFYYLSLSAYIPVKSMRLNYQLCFHYKDNPCGDVLVTIVFVLLNPPPSCSQGQGLRVWVTSCYAFEPTLWLDLLGIYGTIKPIKLP